MANAPDTLLVAGPQFAAIGDALITPTAGTQGKLADKLGSAGVIALLQALPSSDAGLASGALFWNGGFLCQKV